MINDGRIARATIIINCVPVIDTTANKPWNAGTNKIIVNKIKPVIKAAIEYLFEKKPIRYKECWLRQLKPWNKRASNS